MGNLFTLLAVALSSGFLTIPSLGAVTEPKPYKRAVILSGFTINTPLHIGILRGLEEAGMPADVIVSCCGGSVAGAIANALPTMDERIAFVKSREFHETLRSLRFDDRGAAGVLRQFADIHSVVRKNRPLAYRPDSAQSVRFLPKEMFTKSLVKIGDEFERFEMLDQLPRKDGIRWVAVAARIEFPVHPDGSYELRPGAGKKLLTEVEFTDDETAKTLRGVDSLAGTLFPYSPIYPKAEVLTGYKLSKMLRASISDPVLMIPADLNGVRFLGGQVNLDAINVARKLAKEVVGRYVSLFDNFVFGPALEAAYGFPPNELRALVMNRARADVWVDLSDDKAPLISPSLRLDFRNIPNRWTQFVFTVPKSYQDWLALADAQIRFGAQRAREAIAQEVGGQRHIRRPIPRLQGSSTIRAGAEPFSE